MNLRGELVRKKWLILIVKIDGNPQRKKKKKKRKEKKKKKINTAPLILDVRAKT